MQKQDVLLLVVVGVRLNYSIVERCSTVAGRRRRRRRCRRGDGRTRRSCADHIDVAFASDNGEPCLAIGCHPFSPPLMQDITSR